MVETAMNWIKKNQKEFLIILAILLVSAFLRFYRISEYMTFLGDEGRDAIVIKTILVDHRIRLLGPPTSIGNIYLGPLYYYMMAIPMAIFWLNPVAAAGLDGLIGLATIFLVYYLGRTWFGKWAGVISATLYSLSPVNIIYSRSSWNPNPAPFFALLAIYSLYKIEKTGNFLWLILTGISLAFAVQMHYLALILLPIVVILWGHKILYSHVSKQKTQKVIIGTILGVIAFLLFMSPLVFFDLRHDFLNYKAITAFFSNRETTVNLNPFNTLARVIPIYYHNLIGRYISLDQILLTPITAFLVILPIFIFAKKRFKQKILNWPLLALSIWLIIGVLGLALYKQNVYDHYLGFLNAVPYLLLGSIIYLIPKNNRLLLGLFILFVVILNLNDLWNTPLKTPPNNQLKRTQEVSKYVINLAAGRPFNFALIAKSNYDAAYQFYLDMYGHKPKQVPFDITDQLLVVCEDPVCDPVVNPKQEISHFGMTKIDSEASFMGVKVYKLIHNPGGKP